MDTTLAHLTLPTYQIMNNQFDTQLLQNTLIQRNLITCIQISACHRYISVCFKDRDTMETFCEKNHLLTETINITFTTMLFGVKENEQFKADVGDAL